MNQLKYFLLFTAFLSCSIGQAQNLKTEDVFKRYLVSEDEATAKLIANSKDELYSLFCQGDLTEDMTEKITLFSKFIEKEPKFGLAKAYTNRGIANTMTEKYNEAILDFDKAIKLDNKIVYAYYFKGVSYASSENYSDAINNYSLAIQLQPDFTLAYYMKALSYISQENYELALIDLNKVIELKSDYDQGYIMRGFAYYQTGKYENAIADWKKAKKLNKENSKSVDEKIKKAEQKLKEKK